MRIDVATELGRLKIAVAPNEKALRIVCPYHEDTAPSLDVFNDGSGFKCYGCSKAGDFASLLAKLEGKPRHAVLDELLARYGDDKLPVEAELIERYHAAIWGQRSLLDSLAKRGVGPMEIREHRLGADGDKITIPIAGPGGLYVNVRRYLPDQSPDDNRAKLTNMRGRGQRLRLFPYSQLRFDKLILCGGEIKAIATAAIMNKHGYGAIALTGGEKDWAQSLEGFFAGKEVWVCNDVDKVGQQATEMRCERLRGICEDVYPLLLPLDIEQFPHGDLNDFIALHGTDRADAELLALIQAAEPYEGVGTVDSFGYTDPDAPYEEPVDATVACVADPTFVDKRINCDVVVTAVDTSVYYVPRKIKVDCQVGTQDFCSICPVMRKRTNTFEVRPESSEILGMVDTKKGLLHEEIRTALKIPTCKIVQFQTLSNYKVTEARIQKSLQLTENESDKLCVPAVFVDGEAELNETYKITGRPVAHPKTQAATLISSASIAVADSLTSYDPGDTNDLRVFWPKNWELDTIRDWLDEIYGFYSSNVTRIYGRPSLHAFCDLVFHSPLSVTLDDKTEKGWLELLVVGDSSQGKTEVTKSLCEWYGLGIRVDCKNATTAGLLGGLEQMNGKWFAQWGHMAIQDRRLIVLEELKGLHPEVFAKLTECRSSGKAQIPKIHKATTWARARLIALSNPARRNSVMNSYSFGVNAISELVPNPEDVRRFDACVILNKADIDTSLLNQRNHAVTELFDAESAKRLVLWAWTRESTQVVLEQDASDLVYETAQLLNDVYTDSIPIFDRGSTRLKLLRFAAAVAARTFSCSPDGLTLIIRKCHVQYADWLLRTEYESASNGYLAFSQADEDRTGKMDMKDTLAAMRAIGSLQGTAKRLNSLFDLDIQDFSDVSGWGMDESRLIVGRLVRSGALRREKRYYNKTPSFTALLREMAEGKYDEPVPAHIIADTENY